MYTTQYNSISVNLQENEEINAKIAKTRKLRLRKEYDKEKAIKNREMEDFIKEETKALENRIKSKVKLSQNEFMKSSISMTQKI